MLNLNNALSAPRDTDLVGRFKGLADRGGYRRFPHKMYQDGHDPITVEDTKAEAEAKLKGFDALTAGHMANKHLINWFWDLEDLSAKQLVVFAQDEYQIDLPIEAGQEKLFQAVCRLTKAAPQNRNRIVLMAHSVKLNYDETLAEIARTMKHPAEGDEIINEERIFYA